jgi:hypothetical protein
MAVRRGPSRAGRRLRPVLRDIGGAAWSLLTTAAGVGVGIAVVDGVSASGPLAALGAAVLVFAFDALARPVLRRIAVLGSAVAALLLGLLAQVAIISAALTLAPDVSTTGWPSSVLVLLIATAVMASGRWLAGANDSSYVLGHLLRRSRRRAAESGVAGPGTEHGLLVVQLDGVSRTVLERAVDAGLAPTVARWLATGTHSLAGWWAQVPSTTPASQAGLLHRDAEHVPAFRWWDRELERLVVTNRPADAALVEARMCTGRGLLAGGGVAVSTMFSGDAAVSLLVMSRVNRRRGLGPGTSYIRFFADPFILCRAFVLSVSEMVKELYQGHRQRVRGVLPRVPRLGPYVVVRGITNVLLRDLNVALVAEHMMRGAPSIFVDLLDYDEIAHHAGPERPEALRALEGLDRILDLLEQVNRVAPRDYRMVVLSDHGQSLGATFEQQQGCSLADLIRELMRVRPGETVQARSGEEWGPVNALVTAALGRLAPAHGGMVVGPDRERDREPARTDLPEVAVVASGNLGMVWFPRVPARAGLARIERSWPDLVSGLVSCPSIGVVVAQAGERGPVAVGPRGLHWLREGTVEGADPLAPYGPRAAGDLLRVSGLRHCGDLVLLSAVDAAGRVHAFEELVGSHGGLGGPQNDALLLHPAAWPLAEDLLDHTADPPQLVGAVAVHDQLVRWTARDAVVPAGLDGSSAGGARPGLGEHRTSPEHLHERDGAREQHRDGGRRPDVVHEEAADGTDRGVAGRPGRRGDGVGPGEAAPPDLERGGGEHDRDPAGRKQA